MGALYGIGIDNALVEINNQEVPILDGSAKIFVKEILRVGIETSTTPIKIIKINKDADVAICLGCPAFIKKRIGLKKMPPPIPTNPEKKPITDPIRTDKIFGILLILNSLLVKDLLSMSSIAPAIVKIKNNIISNTFLEICNEAP